MNDKLSKPTDPSFALQGTKLRATQTKFQQRVSQGAIDPLTLPYRIMLAVDISGSMAGQPLSDLKKAVENFVSRCDNQTALALRSFGREESEAYIALTLTHFIITSTSNSLRSGGGTPLYSCLRKILSDDPVTRVVLVSDGQPTDSDYHDEIINRYVEQKTPIDCVHIGDAIGGEDELRSIAKRTGGLYIKFTDTNALTSGLSYLTPGCRAMLTSGQVNAASLGAKELK